MRKASIELVAPAKIVTLIAGEFGYGKFYTQLTLALPAKITQRRRNGLMPLKSAREKHENYVMMSGE